MSGRDIRAARRGKRELLDLLAQPEPDLQSEDDTEAFVLSNGERVDPRSSWPLPTSKLPERQIP